MIRRTTVSIIFNTSLYHSSFLIATTFSYWFQYDLNSPQYLPRLELCHTNPRSDDTTVHSRISRGTDNYVMTLYLSHIALYLLSHGARGNKRIFATRHPLSPYERRGVIYSLEYRPAGQNSVMRPCCECWLEFRFFFRQGEATSVSCSLVISYHNLNASYR